MLHLRWIRRGLVLLLVIVSSVTVFLVWDTVSAQAGGGSEARRNEANYALVQDSFEFRNTPYILTLHFRGAAITANTVEWHVVGLPSGVSFASINRINGQNVFSFAGLAPQPEHSFNIMATVMEAGSPVVSVQLVVSIHTA